MIIKVDTVSDGIILVFSDGTIKYYPESALRMLGTKDGCCAFVDYDPSDFQDVETADQPTSAADTSPIH